MYTVPNVIKRLPFEENLEIVFYDLQYTKFRSLNVPRAEQTLIGRGANAIFLITLHYQINTIK